MRVPLAVDGSFVLTWPFRSPKSCMCRWSSVCGAEIIERPRVRVHWILLGE